MKNLQKLGITLNKNDQKVISGGGFSGVPIAPIDEGGTGNGGGNNPVCVCFISGSAVQVPCDSTCPNGTKPFCP